MRLSRWTSRLATRCLSALTAALLLIPVTGCMKMNTSTVIANDGSGTATVRFVVDLAKIDELMEIVKGMMGGMGGDDGMGGGGGAPAGDPPMKKQLDEKMDLEKWKKQLEGKKGIELVSATPIDDVEKRLKGFEAKVKFASLEDFYRAGLDMLVDVKLEDLGGGNFRLTRSNVLPGQEPGAEPNEEEAGQMEMAKMMLGSILESFEMAASITLPSAAVETNGTKDEAGTTVSWKQNFEAMTDAKQRLQTVTFKGEGLKLKPFHIRADQNGKAEDVPAAPAAPAAPVAPEAPKAPEEAPKEPAPAMPGGR